MLTGNSLGVYYMSSNTCTELVATTSNDVFETTQLCTSNINDTVCGTLTMTNARYRGCFPTDPRTDTYYYDNTCTNSWTTANSYDSYNANTVEPSVCKVGMLYPERNFYMTDINGSCVQAFSSGPQSEIKNTICDQGDNYCFK
eukprot:Mrub_09506.p2 GENE.Mrub_09506~~Mrub_09506.p2  ORF type:complete len:163 (-),score=1.81 Mrub_09506:258-686(-)